jgi:3-hydroxybutyryl-CoA dehydrogenase
VTEKRATVVGGGTMGSGIAQVFAQAGWKVTICDVEEKFLERARSRVKENLEGAVARGKLDAAGRDAVLARLETQIDMDAALERAHVVVEAAPEDLALKKELFKTIDRGAGEAVVLATNTSSLPVTEIAQATRRPERVLGLHFFNPPHIQKLVEVVRGERTSDDAVKRALEIVGEIGRDAVLVRDFPGFATTRLGLVLGLEAIRMVEQGVASAEAIDRAMELGYRHPMGPLKTGDLVGLDVRLAIAEHLHRELGDAFRPPVLLRRMVRAGKLGKKSGEGFYRWDAKGECLGPSGGST